MKRRETPDTKGKHLHVHTASMRPNLRAQPACLQFSQRAEWACQHASWPGGLNPPSCFVFCNRITIISLSKSKTILLSALPISHAHAAGIADHNCALFGNVCLMRNGCVRANMPHALHPHFRSSELLLKSHFSLHDFEVSNV